jgi:MtrB/PioB family decaheme-associated outer membrane protein
MTRACVLTFVCSLTAGLALAQEPAPTPAPDNFEEGEFSLGVGQTDNDTLSSKFEEYRDLPNGLFAPSFRFRGEHDGFRWNFGGRDIQERDQQYFLDFGKGAWSIEGDYNQIPHNFGNNGHTLLESTSEGVWQATDALQRNFQTAITSVPQNQVNFNFLNALVTPSLNAANSVDLSLQRERGRVAFNVAPEGPFDITVAYFRERRVGDRAASGTAFGFGNVVELPETLHYLTQDFGADASFSGDWGVLRAGLHYNWFENRVETLAFDNPFRITDSTDASAYQAPGAQSVNGPVFGLMALPPDNSALTGTVGATIMLPKRTRLTGNVSIGQWTQDSSPFIPYTTNTSIVGETATGASFPATDVSRLPASRLDGKMDVTSFNLSATTRPIDRLTLVARGRRYEQSNDTARITFPGYVRFDAVWEEIPRINVPYGFKNDALDAIASYDFGSVTLDLGYKHRGMERTFRETEETSENSFVSNVDVRVADWAILRGTFETGSRDYEHAEMERSEEASFVNPGDPVNVFAIPPPSEDPRFTTVYNSLCGAGGPICNLRYDQAKKDVTRIGAQAQLTPTGDSSFNVAYWRTEDDYTESTFGLTSAKYDTFSLDADYTPNDRVTLYAFYTWEKLADAQRGRQSGATVSSNPLDDWTSDVEDNVNTFGAGGTFALVKDEWFLDVSGHYQKADGNNDIFAPPGGAPANARTNVGGVTDITLYDDTKFARIGGELRYAFAKAWTAAVGGFFEDYEIDDSNTQGLANYVPGSFFLSADDADYQGTVGYLRFTYRW